MSGMVVHDDTSRIFMSASYAWFPNYCEVAGSNPAVSNNFFVLDLGSARIIELFSASKKKGEPFEAFEPFS